MGFDLSATVDKYGAEITRGGLGHERSIEIRHGTVTVSKNGEELFSFNIRDSEEIAELVNSV